MMHLGVHVSTAGGIYLAIERAKSLGCNAIQIFSRNPREWRHSQLEERDIEEFKKRRKKVKIAVVFVHIPYLINLASPFKRLYLDSIKAYIEDIKEAANLGAEYLVTHMGSYRKRSENYGIKRFSEALNIIIEETCNEKVCILLENTSGSGSWLGSTFKHHKIIIDSVKNNDRLGICFDTCHAYSAGYNIAQEQGLEDTLSEIDDLVGLDRLRLVHLNDTKDKLSSRKDHHVDIGSGLIGIDGFRRIINHPKLRDCAFILETPKKSEEDDLKNLSAIRSLKK